MQFINYYKFKSIWFKYYILTPLWPSNIPNENILSLFIPCDKIEQALSSFEVPGRLNVAKLIFSLLPIANDAILKFVKTNQNGCNIFKKNFNENVKNYTNLYKLR